MIRFDQAQYDAHQKRIKSARSEKPSSHKPKKRATVRQIVPLEHDEQVAVIRWWDHVCSSYGLDHRLLVAIPNAGAGASKGQAGKMKAEGVRAGMPDLFFAHGQMRAIEIVYFGLFIELKRIDWKEPSSGAKAQHWRKQCEFHQILRGQGYRVCVCVGHTEAINEIKAYL